jgi:hypothetical protein
MIMSNVQERLVVSGPFDKAGKAHGEMQAIMQASVESVELQFNAQDFYRDTRRGWLYFHASMRVGQDRSVIIAIALRDKDAASGTYTVPGDKVVLLSYIREGNDPDSRIEYRTTHGSIEFENHQPAERISGRFQFTTETVNGISYRAIGGRFDIVGMN